MAAHYDTMTSISDLGEAAPHHSQGNAAFEAWLHASLRGTYGAADAEPLPEALLRICETAPGGDGQTPSTYR